MSSVNIIIAGFGRVGRAFGRVLEDKRRLCRERYGLDLIPRALLKSDGGILSGNRLPLEAILTGAPNAIRDNALWQQGLKLADIIDGIEPGVLVECTPTDLKTGEPGLTHILSALEHGWNVAAASKGAQVLKFRELTDLAREKNVRLMSSGATAAALPTLDVGLGSLAGTEVLGIEAILNGTTNYILTKMEDGATYAQALEEAQARGIAEPDPTMDVEGWDTAAKLLLISNAVVGTAFHLDDVRVTGIRDIAPDLAAGARRAGKALKLMGTCSKELREHPWSLDVGLALVDGDHPLFGVGGTDKGIVFYTDTMGRITVVGGKSDPVGTGAALLKDIINIYR